MYGWRARIGILMAHLNTTMEPEFNRLAPKGVSFHASRLHVSSLSVQGMNTADNNLASAAQMLQNINVRSVAYSCNSATIVEGIEGEEKQARIVSEACGVPALLSSTAILEALAALELNRVSFATLYPSDLNERSNEFWKSCGVNVIKAGGMPMKSTWEKEEPYSPIPVSRIGCQPPMFAYNVARTVCDKPTDAVVMIGGNVRTIEIIEDFEKDFGVTFISTNSALLWASLQVAGIKEPILGYGRLLRENPPLKWVRLKK